VKKGSQTITLKKVKRTKVMVTQFEELNDFQWEVIEDLFPEQEKCEHCLRTVLNAILWLLRTGTQWRNMESKYPPWPAIYHHFRKWKNDGRFEKMNQRLNEMERYSIDKEDLPSAVSSDSQSIKISSFIGKDTGVDGGKKIKGRKRHIITDTTGLVLGVFVTAANAHDGTTAIRLFGKAKELLTRMKKVYADGSYRGSFEEYVQKTFEAEVEISSRPPGEKGFVPVKIRWVTERTFGWFNFFRRLSKDYEKTIESSATWILLANSQIILSRMR
jgi:putative transposase